MEYREDIVRLMVEAIILTAQKQIAVDANILTAHQQIVADAKIFRVFSAQCWKRSTKLRGRKQASDAREGAEKDAKRWFALTLDLCSEPFTHDVVSFISANGQLTERHEAILSRIRSYMDTPELQRREPPDFSDLFPTTPLPVETRANEAPQ